MDILEPNTCVHSRIQVGSPETPPLGPISFIFMHFLGDKIGQIKGWHHHLGYGSPGKSWIHYWCESYTVGKISASNQAVLNYIIISNLNQEKNFSIRTRHIFLTNMSDTNIVDTNIMVDLV